MFKKAVIMLSIFVLAVSAVSAAENVSDDIAGTADSDVICIDENEDSLNCDESVLQSDVNNSAEVLSAENSTAIATGEVLGAVNADSAEPVLKSSHMKKVKMKIKYHWKTKKVGKYKIKARLWKVRYAYGFHNYVDIILYKHGKKLSNYDYISTYKFKKNGRWQWWPSWRCGGVDHAYHRYVNDLPVKAIMVKFWY